MGIYKFLLILLLVNVVLFGVIAMLYRMVRQQAANLEELTREMHEAVDSVPEDALADKSDDENDTEADDDSASA